MITCTGETHINNLGAELGPLELILHLIFCVPALVHNNGVFLLLGDYDLQLADELGLSQILQTLGLALTR